MKRLENGTIFLLNNKSELRIALDSIRYSCNFHFKHSRSTSKNTIFIVRVANIIQTLNIEASGRIFSGYLTAITDNIFKAV